MIKLVISDNEGTTTVVPLVRDEISIGRQEGNTIRLTERNVSRRHARLMAEGDSYVLEDLGAYNGLLLNGEPLSGRVSLRSGDEIVIGDYRMRVHAETYSAAPNRPASIAPPPATPARIVMLTEPAPGAEFSLSDDKPLCLGRSEDLDVPVNHRSVSREHAEIAREREQFVVNDLRSANGVLVNGSRVQRQALVPGDIVELGEVAFRFVGPGERYFFNPDDAVRYARASTVRSKENTRLAAILLGSAVVIAAVILLSGRSDDEMTLDEQYEAEMQAKEGASADGAAGALSYARALSACQESLDGQRYAEAEAHADMALKSVPGDTDATQCKQEARRLLEDEQIFMRGQAALLKDDAETAYRLFADLSPNSPFLERTELQEAVDKVAKERLASAGMLMATEPMAAVAEAEAVTAMPQLSAVHREAAVALLDAARNAAQAVSNNDPRSPGAGDSEAPGKTEADPGKSAGQASHKPVSHKPAPTPVQQSPAKPTATPPASPTPAPAARASTRTPTRTPRTPVAQNPSGAKQQRGAKSDTSAAAKQDGSEEGSVSAWDKAMACMARGDNVCTVAALAGKARSERELALLIETYRTMGNTASVLQYMDTYVKRFPTSKNAEKYRDQLARAGR